MFKRWLPMLAVSWLAASAWAAEPLTLSGELQELDRVPVTQLEALDRQALLAEDAGRETQPGVAPRFAIPQAAAISLHTNGTWETARDGTQVWRLRIHATKARSINLAFSHYHLPENAELHLFSEDGKYRIRPFTAADNKPHGELWTPIVRGETLVLELQVPAQLRDEVRLEIGSINYGYRGFFEPVAVRSGACNVDVVCPEGDDWQYPISTVAVISTGGGTFCTGFMVNNAEYDGTPYFMTANHCSIDAGNAASLVTYWNYENSTCRPPGSPESGGPGDGTLDEFNTGSTFRAAGGASDFTLVELDNQPDPAWDVGYAGWDARDQATSEAIAIHHPSTDEKRISFEYDPTSITAYLSDTVDPNQTHIRVEDWDVGTTEPGSSGSPLFSPEGRVIGQLHGGYAACGNDDPDWYGRMAYSWEAGGSASGRLKDWLDPQDTGTLVVDGLGEEGFGLEPESESISQCGFDDIDLGIDLAQFGEFTDPVTLSATGTPTGVTASFSTNPVTPPGSTILTLGELSQAGTSMFQFDLEGSGGDVDETVQISVSLNDDAPGEAPITSPTDGALGVSTTPTITWDAADQGFDYTLEIATDGAFSNLVYSAAMQGTSHEVADELDTSATYHVRVGSSNDCGSGNWSPTVSFTTEALPGDCPMGTASSSLLDENFDGADLPSGWSTDGSSGTVNWTMSSTQSHSGSHSVFAENIGSETDQRLASPAVSLPSDAVALFLTFQNWQEIEDNAGTGCYDGGFLEISNDDGGSWSQVTSDAIQVRDYDGPISSGFSNPLGGNEAWCGDPRDFWERYSIDLSDWAGQDVRFRWRFGTDSSVSRYGWHVDSVEVKACEGATGPLIFEDRFKVNDSRPQR